MRCKGIPLSAFHAGILLALHMAVAAAPVAHAYLTEKVVVIVIDGARDTEFLEQPGHVLATHIWNDLRPQGYLSHSFYNAGPTLTVPGHAGVITGTLQDIGDDGLTRPTRPTLFEEYRRSTGAGIQSGQITALKTKIAALTFSTFPGYGQPFEARFVGPYWNDIQVSQAWMEDVRETNPTISLLALGQPDGQAHSGNWSGYTRAIARCDSIVFAVWNWIQATPGWAGRTTLFITNDHGRHPDPGWQDHGDDCSGCRHLGFLALGPDFAQNVETWEPAGDQRDIAVTAAELLGVSMPHATGRVLWELFSTVAGGVGPESDTGAIPRRDLRLVVEPNPAYGAIRVRMPARSLEGGWWSLALIDPSGRVLWRGGATGGELTTGASLALSSVAPASGVAWLRAISPTGKTAGGRVVWIR